MQGPIPVLVVLLTLASVEQAWSAAAVYPGKEWETRTPEQVGLDPVKLKALEELVGGRGCIVRHGYLAYSWGDITKSADVASAFKPLLSTLLLMAVRDGKLRSVDAPLADVEPRLASLNGGKDARITWRHLASQTSGYGLSEAPGEAWAYNDFAITLYYDTLMDKVYRKPGTEVLKEQLAEVLQFQDPYSFEAFGPKDRPGRLGVSVRDFARFGLLWLHKGRWRNRQLIPPRLVKLALTSVVPAGLPRTQGKEAAMLPGQRSMGGGKDITGTGPGFYTFNWWVNGRDRLGRRLFASAPDDLLLASGHGGIRALWIIPSLDLVASWNDTRLDDHDVSPENPDSKHNQAARLLREAVVGK